MVDKSYNMIDCEFDETINKDLTENQKKRFKDFLNQAVPFGPSLACSSILFITYFK